MYGLNTILSKPQTTAYAYEMKIFSIPIMNTRVEDARKMPPDLGFEEFEPQSIRKYNPNGLKTKKRSN